MVFTCKKCNAPIKCTDYFCKKCGEKADRQGNLIMAARNNDQSAYTELYNQVEKTVRVTVFSMVSPGDINNPDAEDIVVESILKGFKSLYMLKDPDSFVPWMRQIARNKSIDYLRQNKDVNFSELDTEDGDFEDTLVSEDKDTQPELVMEDRVKADLLRDILESLPDEQRVVMTMFYYHQMTIPEIAYELGTGEATVKSRLKYGKAKVEKGVTELQKKHGIKLYSITPAFFIALFFGFEKAMPSRAAVQSSVMASVSGISSGSVRMEGASRVVNNSGRADGTSAKAAGNTTAKTAGSTTAKTAGGATAKTAGSTAAKAAAATAGKAGMSVAAKAVIGIAAAAAVAGGTVFGIHAVNSSNSGSASASTADVAVLSPENEENTAADVNSAAADTQSAAEDLTETPKASETAVPTETSTPTPTPTETPTETPPPSLTETPVVTDAPAETDLSSYVGDNWRHASDYGGTDTIYIQSISDDGTVTFDLGLIRIGGWYDLTAQLDGNSGTFDTGAEGGFSGTLTLHDNVIDLSVSYGGYEPDYFTFTRDGSGPSSYIGTWTNVDSNGSTNSLEIISIDNDKIYFTMSLSSVGDGDIYADFFDSYGIFAVGSNAYAGTIYLQDDVVEIQISTDWVSGDWIFTRE